MTCWRCHERVEGPVCAGCGAIQPPPPDPEFFALLGLPRRFHMEEAALTGAWRDLSRLVHPDRFAGHSAVERRMSLQWTSLINTVRRVLKEPVSRARYLASGRTSPPEQGGPRLDPEFLEEMFDLRIAATEDPEAVRPEGESRRAALWAELDAIFSAWEAGQGGLTEVEERLARLKYLDNLLHGMD